MRHQSSISLELPRYAPPAISPSAPRLANKPCLCLFHAEKDGKTNYFLDRLQYLVFIDAVVAKIARIIE
jgi:hypothetical protein